MQGHCTFGGLDTCSSHAFRRQVVHNPLHIALNPRRVQQQHSRGSHVASAHADTLCSTSSNGGSSDGNTGSTMASASSTSSNGRNRIGLQPVQPAEQQQQQQLLASTEALHLQRSRTQPPDQQRTLQQHLHATSRARLEQKQQKQQPQQQLARQQHGSKQHGRANQHQRHQQRQQKQDRIREDRLQLQQQTWQQQEHLMQQQRQQLLQQHLQRCTHWKQLLPIAAAPIAETDPAWVAAIAVKAARLRPFPSAAAAAADASAAAVQGSSSSDSNSAAASAAMTAVVSTSGLAGNIGRIDSSQHLYFIQQLLLLLGTHLAAATAAAAAPGPPAALLCQLLSQLAAVGIRPHSGWLQEKLVPYLRTRYTRMQPEEVLAVLVGLSAVQPEGLAVQIGLQKRLLRSVVSEMRPCPPVHQVARVLHAAARLKWQPSQRWVQQAAVALLLQLKQCRPSELAMALWGLAMLRCDMTLLHSSLQQQQQWRLQDSSGAVSTSENDQQQGRTQHQQQTATLTPQQQQQQRQQQQAVQPAASVQQAVQPAGAVQQAVQRPVALAPQQLLQSVLNCTAEFTAQELLCVLWATAELPLLPQQQLVQTLLSHCLQPAVLQQYSAADLSGILWFLARMQHQTDIEQWQQQQQSCSLRQWILKKRKQRQQSGQQQQQKQHLMQDNTLVTLQMVQPVLDALLFQLPLVRSQHLATAMRSIALLGIQPPRLWVARVLHHSHALIPSMEPSCLVQLVSAVADLKYLPTDSWLGSIYAATQPRLVEFAAAVGVPTSSNSSSSSGSSTSASTSTSTTSSSSSTIRAREIEVLAGAILKLSTFHSQPNPSQKPPAAWLAAMAQASSRVLAGSPSPEQMSFWGRVLHRFSSLAGEPWPGPGRHWWLQYVQLTQPMLANSSPWVLSNVIHVLAQPRQQRQIGRLDSSWAQGFLDASRGVLRPRFNSPSSDHSSSSSDLGDLGGPGGPRFDRQDLKERNVTTASAAELVAMGKSLARLQILPDQVWQQDWLSAVEQADASMTGSMRASVSWAVLTFKTLTDQQQQQQQQQIEQRPTLLPLESAVADASMPLASSDGDMNTGSSSGGAAEAQLLQAAPDSLNPSCAAAAAAPAAAVTLTYSDEEFETSQGYSLAGSNVNASGTASVSSSTSSSTGSSGTDTATQVVQSNDHSGCSLRSVDGSELAKQLHYQWEHQQRSIDDLQGIVQIEISKMQHPS